MQKKQRRISVKDKKHIDLNIDVRTLNTLDDIAIRSYYVYKLLVELVKEQRKSVLDVIALPLSIAASLIAVFLLIEKLWSPTFTIIIYAIAMMILIVASLIERHRQKSKESLEEQIYLAIYVDEMMKGTKELTIIIEYGNPKDAMSQEFVHDAAESLEACIEDVEMQVEELAENRIYPGCLADFGMNEDFVNKTLTQAKDCVEKAKLFLNKLPATSNTRIKKLTRLKKRPHVRRTSKRKKPKHIRVTKYKKISWAQRVMLKLARRKKHTKFKVKKGR